jgi:RNA polymerase sigma-70 factor (ECF subfamily)
VQETFARVLARPRLLRGEDDLSYLMGVLRNTFLTGRRTASRRPATVEHVSARDTDPMGRPDEALEIREVYSAIAALPENSRMALVAVDVLGLSYREAARALRVREATLTTRLFRARRQVSRQFVSDAQAADGGTRQGHGARPEPQASRRRPREGRRAGGVFLGGEQK